MSPSLVLFLAACASPPAATAPIPRAAVMVDGYYQAAGAPDPLACASDDECVTGGTVDDGGCCWTYRDTNATVMNRAYRDWVQTLRAQCAVEACPPLRVPSQPPACLFEVSCREGRCVNECG